MSEQRENTQLMPYVTWKVRQAVDELLSSATPVSAINALMARTGAPGVSPFERYAGLVLRDAGAARLSELPPSCAILLSPPAEARLARLTCTTALDEDRRALVENVENAINRLCCIADAIEDSGTDGRDKERSMGISLLGRGFLNDRASYHSACVKLPRIGRSEQPSIRYFSEVDWRVLDHIASTAHPVFQASVLPNMHQAFAGAYAPDGSDWDVRTRLASLLEGLELPLRFSYEFDVDVPRQTVSIAFTLPSVESFPTRAFDPARDAFVDMKDRLDRVRIAYAMRFSCLLAAAAFGSGRKIEHAVIAGMHRGDTLPAFTCSFKRKQYVYQTLTAIDEGKLADPAIRFDTAAIARTMSPCAMEYVRFDGASHVDFPQAMQNGNRIETHLDERTLPDDMRSIFHARRICDIDTRHYFGPGAQAITDARADSNTSTIAAIAHLERITSELEHDTTPPDDNASARALYCANPMSRAVVSLLDDDLAVSAQAEAFLHGEPSDDPAESSSPEYFRAPDALYHAHMGLSDLYERLGDIRGSEMQANRCIALAPTSAGAYFRKADVLASQRRYPEAANVLVEGLRYAASPRDCALLYYHLALILWNTGKKREAVAVHVYTASLSGEYADKARRVVVNLRKRSDSPVIVYASPLAATREMARARIPVAPSDTVRTLIVKTAVGLSCADAPTACTPYAAALPTYFRDDSIIASACRSIQFGVDIAT